MCVGRGGGGRTLTFPCANVTPLDGKQLRAPPPQGHAAPVTAVQCDENRVVSAASDGTVSVWDIRSGKELFQIYGHYGGIRSLQFDREQLITDGGWCMAD